MSTRIMSIITYIIRLKPSMYQVLWFIYIALLVAILPHTSWWFAKSHPVTDEVLSWILAIVFECGIFAFTHRIVTLVATANRKRQLEKEGKWAFRWRRISAGYVNLSGLGLLVTSGVSGFANWSYAVEHGGNLAIYSAPYMVSPLIYEFAAGGILPLVSFFFSYLLAEMMSEREAITIKKTSAISKREEKLREKYKALSDQHATRQKQIDQLRADLDAALTVSSGVGDLSGLLSEQGKDRYLALRGLYSSQDVPAAWLAKLAGVSESYASQLNNNGNGKGVVENVR